MRLTPMELRFVSKAIKFGAKVRGHAKEIVGGTLAGAAVAGAAYGVNRKLASRPLPPPPETFPAKTDLGHNIYAEGRLNYVKSGRTLTPRLQSRIRRKPNRPVWVKKKGSNTLDRAWSPNAKIAATAAGVGGAMAVLTRIHR